MVITLFRVIVEGHIMAHCNQQDPLNTIITILFEKRQGTHHTRRSEATPRVMGTLARSRASPARNIQKKYKFELALKRPFD